MSEVSIEGLVEELMECSDSALDDRVRALETQRRKLEAELAVTTGEIDRRRSYLDDGHRSLKAYLRATCNYSDVEAARIGRLTSVAADVPGVADALHRGHIGTSQANELAVAHTNLRIRDRLGDFAPMLLELAERLSFREFRICVQRFVMLADLDGAHHDLDESIRTRRAHIVNLNGSLCLDAGGGDPLVNVELDAIFRRFCELEYQADVAARRAEHGDHADEHPLPRTATQRGYDAFVAIMRGALANHEAGRPALAAEPLVSILVDHRTWGRVLAQAGLAPDATLAGERVDPFTGLASPEELLADLMGDPGAIGSRRCETSTGQILDPHTVLRAALAGHIRRAVLGADNLPINLGRQARVFTGHARRAAKLLAVQCDHPGCGLAAEVCEVDHSVEWADNGRTDQNNAGVECGSHNRLKHRRRWRTRRDIDGRTHTIRADGTIMLPVGARPPIFPDDTPPITGETDPTVDVTVASGVERSPKVERTSESERAPGFERTLDRWVGDATGDVDRRCRTLRRAALRHAISLDDLDADAVSLHLETAAMCHSVDGS